MPYDFAARLFDATRLGMRVIVAPTDAAPVDIAHPACMGLSLSRYHGIFVFLCHSILLFDPRRRAFFRPDRIFPSPSRAAAVKDGASSAPPKARP